MKNLLLVDDEKLYLKSLSEMIRLYDGNLSIMTASNGEQAVGILENAKVDLLITDLNMPVRSGFELLNYMLINLPETPVIVMTASVSEETGEKLRSLHVRHHVTKPFKFEKLNVMIHNILNTNGQAGQKK